VEHPSFLPDYPIKNMRQTQIQLKLSALLLLVFFAILIGLVMIQANPYTKSPGRDNGFFLYSGSQILKGKLPYIDFWDSKGPGIFYINALGLLIGKGSRWGVWLLEAIFLFVETVFFFKVTRKKWGHGTALFATMAWLFALLKIFDGGNFTEEYSLLLSFLALSYFLYLDKKSNKKLALLVGITFSLNFLFRANNIGVPISIALAIFFAGIFSQKYTKVRHLIFYTSLASLTVFIITYLYFLQKGFFAEMFEASILYNFFYSKSQHVFYLNFWQGVQYIGLPAYSAISGYLIILYNFTKKNFRKDLSPIHVFLLIHFPLELILSSISGRIYLHYFILWIPAIAILNAFAFSMLAKKIFSLHFLELWNDRKYSLIIVFPLLLLFYINSGALKEYQDTLNHILFERAQGIEYNDPVADFLRENTDKDAKILAWGAYPSLNYSSKRDAPTAYLFYPAYAKSPYTEDMGLSFAQDIATNPPAMIVDTFHTSPDYILSLDPAIRQSQIQRTKKVIYENTPYQTVFFEFVEEYFQHIETINGFDIYEYIELEE
jgi:hypothetical protein